MVGNRVLNLNESMGGFLDLCRAHNLIGELLSLIGVYICGLRSVL